jgi:hypothetical protein
MSVTRSFDAAEGTATAAISASARAIVCFFMFLFLAGHAAGLGRRLAGRSVDRCGAWLRRRD